jgi:hypothetical protein
LRWFFYAFPGTKLASVNGKGIKTPTTEGGQVFRGFEAPPGTGSPDEGKGNPAIFCVDESSNLEVVVGA